MLRFATGFGDLADDPTITEKDVTQDGHPFFRVGGANVLMGIDGLGGLLVMDIDRTGVNTPSDETRLRIAQHMQATLAQKGYHCAAYNGGYGEDSVVVAINELGEPRGRLEKYRDVKEAAEKAAVFFQKFETAQQPPANRKSASERG